MMALLLLGSSKTKIKIATTMKISSDKMPQFTKISAIRNNEKADNFSKTKGARRQSRPYL
jgi:hypothetical protein